jgi:hypothetical protein
MGRTWVPIAGAIVGLVFVLTQLTGSDIDEQAARAGITAATLVLFTIFGSTGIALVHWQPRFALLGIVATTLALLAGGAIIALTWSDAPSFFFLFFDGTSGTVVAITEMLVLTSSAISVLLATTRPGEDGGTRLVRLTAIGSLTLLLALAILEILDRGVEIGPRVYAILATVFAIATVALLVLRLLPLAEDSPAPS